MASTARVVDPLYVPFTVTTPAGTLQTAPLSTRLTVPHGTLETCDLLIPSGHCGTTGIRLQLAGGAILPFSNPPAWIIADDLKEQFTLGVEVDSGLFAVTYNEGNYSHSHYLRLVIRTLPKQSGLKTVNLVDLNASA